jgi:coenzyme F420-reducing hydrogenase delta subunit/ferredoxin
MSEANGFEPKIVAYVCNWCTYLGADLAGTTRLEYPPNVRIIRLPCTGRIDFNLIVKAFEIGADSVLVSGCHPGDCHYTSGNYHARRRWILFRELLDTLGFDMRRIHFSWISAAEGKKFQQVVTEITEQTRELGPYTDLYQVTDRAPKLPAVTQPPTAVPPALEYVSLSNIQDQLRSRARELLSDGVRVVIGYGSRGPLIITRPEDADDLVWDRQCYSNLTAYLKRKEIKALGKAAVVVKPCDEKSLLVLEKESQIERRNLHVLGVACEGMGKPKCGRCKLRAPRFSDETFGDGSAREVTANPAPGRLVHLKAMTPPERMSFWTEQFQRCIQCYACRQVCPLCYCERCIVEKNRPVVINPGSSIKGIFAWQIARAFHLSGRCVGCGECTRACPAGIDLGLLNIAMRESAIANFGYEAGMDPSADPAIGSYDLQDKEEFIL